VRSVLVRSSLRCDRQLEIANARIEIRGVRDRDLMSMSTRAGQRVRRNDRDVRAHELERREQRRSDIETAVDHRNVVISS
jgi:hypothetical protein